MEEKQISARALALKLLCRVQALEQFSNIALDKALQDSTLTDADKRLCTRLFYGVTEKLLTLDFRISELSSRPLSEIDKTTLNILRIGLYQLMFMDKIPTHAAVNEAVSLANRRTSGFVNAVLRAHIRKPEPIFPDKEENPVGYLSAAYSVCEELAVALLDIYGFERTCSILSSLAPPPTTLSVNTLKISREALEKRIDSSAPTPYSKNGLYVTGSVRELDGFDTGLFFVQDEASQLCVEALDAHDSMRVLDICACPGSKSFGTAISMKNRGEVIAFDLHKNKLSLIEDGAKRLGIDIINTKAQDGRHFLPELEESADRVLCDVPCSGFGVLAKKPELRYKSPDASRALPDIQLAILENACKYVKAGGVLVYSTCTILPAENEHNIRRFLEKHREFSLCPFEAGELCAADGFITLLPDEYPTDGFFIAKLRKNK